MIHLVFTPPDLPPALNGSNGLLRMHWSKKKVIKTNFMWLIKEQRPQKMEGQVTLVMTNYCIRPMDWDNLASRLKIIGDGMVKMSLIEDDNPNIIVDFDMKQVRVKKKADVRLEFLFKSIV